MHLARIVMMAFAICWFVGPVEAQDEPPTSIVIIGIGTAHPSGVSTLFSNVPRIDLVWAPIDMRRLDIDRGRPLFTVSREYCNPLALARDSCPAADPQIQYSAYEVPAGVYMLQSVAVSDSDLIKGASAATELFYPPDHLIFLSTLPDALEDDRIPKLLLAPGGIYYVGNFILDYDAKSPIVARVERNDHDAAAVVREQNGDDLPISFLETAVAFFRGQES